MKKLIFITLALFMTAVFLPAREYSYLDPPSISVMDFEVNIEEPLSAGTAVSKEYFGQLINHTLVTVLIQKNNEFGLVIPRHPHFAALNYADADEGMSGALKTDAEFFPPLLKIYDKKYVEMALKENNFTINDLYTKSPDAFNFPDLDFVVLGNVFRYEGDKIAINVRVLNTYRGEELFAYSEFVSDDMSGLYEVCDLIAHQIIIDILTNYCSVVMVKSIQFVDPNEVDRGQFTKNENFDRDAWLAEVNRRQEAVEDRYPYQLFFQSNQEVDNTAQTIQKNHTFKKQIARDRFYFTLPGTYTLTVYNDGKQSLQEIPIELKPRDIKIHQLKIEDLDAQTGSITITDWKPTDAYQIEVVEMERDPKYIWEVGNDRLGYADESLKRNFKDGSFILPSKSTGAGGAAADEGLGPIWLYNAAKQELTISRLGLMKYSVRLTPLPEKISKEDIFGILRVSSRAIESSDAVDADLRFEKDVVLDVSDFGLKETDVSNEFKKTRITFLIPRAFELYSVSFAYTEGDREGSLYFWDYEKLIVEGSYTEEEWNDFVSVNYLLEGTDFNFSTKRTPVLTFAKEEIEAAKDKIVVVNLSDTAVSGFSIDTGVEEKKTFGDWLKGIFGGKKEDGK